MLFFVGLERSVSAGASWVFACAIGWIHMTNQRSPASPTARFHFENPDSPTPRRERSEPAMKFQPSAQALGSRTCLFVSFVASFFSKSPVEISLFATSGESTLSPRWSAAPEIRSESRVDSQNRAPFRGCGGQNPNAIFLIPPPREPFSAGIKLVTSGPTCLSSCPAPRAPCLDLDKYRLPMHYPRQNQEG